MFKKWEAALPELYKTTNINKGYNHYTIPTANLVFLKQHFKVDIASDQSSGKYPIKGTLMQIWKSSNIFVFLWK